MRRFSEQEIRYLKGMPAVENATESRIVYSDQFKDECLRQWRAGESVTKVFRAAGLPPELVGYKRIERAISRWRGSEDRIRRQAHASGSRSDTFAAPFGGADPAAMAPEAVSWNADAVSDALTGRMTPGFDVRDILIVQQIRRIAELEQQVDALRVAISARRNTAPSAAAPDQAADLPASSTRAGTTRSMKRR